jgi:hypothetical protein
MTTLLPQVSGSSRIRAAEHITYQLDQCDFCAFPAMYEITWTPIGTNTGLARACEPCAFDGIDGGAVGRALDDSPEGSTITVEVQSLRTAAVPAVAA